MSKPPTGPRLRLLLRAGHPDGYAALIAGIKSADGRVRDACEALGLARPTLYRLSAADPKIAEILREHGIGADGTVEALVSARKRAGKRKMSYAKKNRIDSDVYVFSDGKSWYCHECELTPPSFSCSTAQAMIEHLAAHRAAGHRVPDAAIARLETEQKGRRLWG